MSDKTGQLDNLDWIRNLLNSLPEMPTVRKDILSIAGFPNWENVHSNILAFYFDENEEHGFGRLFLDSLLELCKRELDDFSSDYTVDREVSCDNNKRIDLLIQSNSDDWAVIIENKIYAKLYNNLGIYWKAPKNVENKVGIVLSLHKVEISDKHRDNFINVTHAELLEKVKSNLGQYYMSADDRHLLILKEYIANIENRKRNEERMHNLEQELKLYMESKDEIKQFLKRREQSKELITSAVRQAMIEQDFHPQIKRGCKDTTEKEHYYINDNKTYKTSNTFRFWFNHNAVLESKQLDLRFELYGKGTKYAEKLISRLENKVSGLKDLGIDLGGVPEKNHCHIYSIKKMSLFDESIAGEDFAGKLRNLIDQLFFQTTGNNEKSLLELAFIELENILKQEEQ